MVTYFDDESKMNVTRFYSPWQVIINSLDAIAPSEECKFPYE